MVERLTAAIRPHPHRGDVVAAGAALLTVGVATVDVRMAQRWDSFTLLVPVATGAALVLAMGMLAPMEGQAPRAYQSLLLVAGLLLSAIALHRLAQVLGSEHPGAGAVTWAAALQATLAGALARARNSAICTLIAAVTAWIALLAFVQWAFAPEGPDAFRWVLTLTIAALALASTSQRDRRRRHAVALANAAGLAAIAVGLVPRQPEALTSWFAGTLAGDHLGAGWALILALAGFGLLSYGLVDREPGPSYIGFFVLVAFVVRAGAPGDTATLVGWPLLLVALGAGGLVLGLRPRRPLPPAPDADAEQAPTMPLRPFA